MASTGAPTWIQGSMGSSRFCPVSFSFFVLLSDFIASGSNPPLTISPFGEKPRDSILVGALCLRITTCWMPCPAKAEQFRVSLVRHMGSSQNLGPFLVIEYITGPLYLGYPTYPKGTLILGITHICSSGLFFFFYDLWLQGSEGLRFLVANPPKCFYICGRICLHMYIYIHMSIYIYVYKTMMEATYPHQAGFLFSVVCASRRKCLLWVSLVFGLATFMLSLWPGCKPVIPQFFDPAP